MLATSFGKALKLLQNWRSMPDRKDDLKIRRAHKLEGHLSRLANANVRLSYMPMKQHWLDGEAAKKRAIIILMNQTQSAHKRLFLFWHT